MVESQEPWGLGTLGLRKISPTAAVACFVVVTGQACTGQSTLERTIGSTPVAPVAPSAGGPDYCDSATAAPPHVYGTKIKNLLTGLALRADELEQLREDPETLRSMVGGWIETPHGKRKLQEFFATAFQQDSFEDEGLARQLGESSLAYGNVADQPQRAAPLLVENLRQSFGRTALRLMEEGRSFGEVATTRRFMMTTAMMIAYAFNDERVVDDEGNLNRFRTFTDEVTVTFQRQAPVPAEALFDPASPDYLRFYTTREQVIPPCAGETIEARPRNVAVVLFRTLFGRFPRFTDPDPEFPELVAEEDIFLDEQGEEVQRICRGRRGALRYEGYLRRSDFEDWRMVTIRPPESGEVPDSFLDIAHFRQGAETLVLHTPRVGFFTTPAFFAVWETNEDNQARVTLNQTLITAFGDSIDGSQVVVPATEDGLDAEHADPSTSCWGCHRTLDPMRQFFRRDFTFAYTQQQDPEVRGTSASFAWRGVEGSGDSIYDLGELIAAHPRLAEAWTQKLCFFANSEACPSGPELDRVVDSFRRSDLDFATLLVELMTSPLVTATSCVEDGSGDVASIARRRHFCAALQERLGVSDPCGVYWYAQEDRSTIGRENEAIASAIPDDAFSRGDEDPLTVSGINLFVSGAYERICANIAPRAVTIGSPFDPSNPEAAIGAMVTDLMGVPPNDPRHDALRDALRRHYDESVDAYGRAIVALQSTFTVACQSPTITGIGF